MVLIRRFDIQLIHIACRDGSARETDLPETGLPEISKIDSKTGSAHNHKPKRLKPVVVARSLKSDANSCKALSNPEKAGLPAVCGGDSSCF